MKPVIILIGRGQLEQVIEDLQAGQKTMGTNTVVLVLSHERIEVRNGAFTMPPGATIYVGPIHTLGFTASSEEVQEQFGQRRAVN